MEWLGAPQCLHLFDCTLYTMVNEQFYVVINRFIIIIWVVGGGGWGAMIRIFFQEGMRVVENVSGKNEV